MYKSLLRRIQQLVLLNPQQQRDLCALVRPSQLPKDCPVLEAGDVSDHIYFVEAGILRSFCQIDGRCVTRWFCFPDHFATAYFSFVYRRPSEDTIVAVTDVQLLSLSYTNLQYLTQRDGVWIDLNRRLLETHYTAAMERIMAFQTQSAAERYRQLLREQPQIESLVPLGQIASFLGMSPETLSRLRRRRQRRG